MADSNEQIEKSKFVITDLFSHRPDTAMDYAMNLALKTAEKVNSYPTDAKICILYRDGESVELAATYHESEDEKFALNRRWNFIHEDHSSSDREKAYTSNIDLVITTDEYLDRVSNYAYDFIVFCCDNKETKQMIIDSIDILDHNLYHKCKENGQIEYIVSSL